jgi:hypothetical protein
MSSLQVLTRFDGSVILTVNDTYTVKVSLGPIPLFVIGSDSLFSFKTNSTNGQMPTSHVAVLQTPDNQSIVVPSRSNFGHIASPFAHQQRFGLKGEPVKAPVDHFVLTDGEFRPERVPALDKAIPRSKSLEHGLRSVQISVVLLFVLIVVVLWPELRALGARRVIASISLEDIAGEDDLKQILESVLITVAKSNEILSVKEKEGVIVLLDYLPFSSYGRRPRVLREIANIPVFCKLKDIELNDLLEKMRKCEIAIEDCLKHPFFWRSSKVRSNFLEKLGGFSDQLETRSSLVFSNDWKATFALFDQNHRQFIESEVSKGYVKAETDTGSLKALIGFINAKMRHVQKSAPICCRGKGMMTLDDWNQSFFGFLVDPFPSLILATYDLVQIEFNEDFRFVRFVL